MRVETVRPRREGRIIVTRIQQSVPVETELEVLALRLVPTLERRGRGGLVERYEFASSWVLLKEGGAVGLRRTSDGLAACVGAALLLGHPSSPPPQVQYN